MLIANASIVVLLVIVLKLISTAPNHFPMTAGPSSTESLK